MFSVYGVSGRLFMGAASDMPQVPGVRSLLRLRHVGAIGLDPSASETGENQRRAASPAQAPASARPLSAYEQAPAPARRPLSLVQDVMTLAPQTMTMGQSAVAALEVLDAQGWAQAPVVDDQGILVGLLLSRDVRSGPVQTVAKAMVSPVPSVLAETDVRQVARVLLDTGLPGLPVVDANGVVTGLVTRSDLLRALAHEPPLDLWG